MTTPNTSSYSNHQAKTRIRGGRHFNLEKQTQQYDPEGLFIKHWKKTTGAHAIDIVDAADWPIG